MEKENAIGRINSSEEKEDSLDFGWDFGDDNLLINHSKSMLPSQHFQDSMQSTYFGGGHERSEPPNATNYMQQNGTFSSNPPLTGTPQFHLPTIVESMPKDGGGQSVQPHEGSLIHQNQLNVVSEDVFRVEPMFSSICTTMRVDQPARNATNSFFNDYIQQESLYGTSFPAHTTAAQFGATDGIGSSTQVRQSRATWLSPNQFTQYETMLRPRPQLLQSNHQQFDEVLTGDNALDPRYLIPMSPEPPSMLFSRGTSLHANRAIPEYPSQYAFELSSIMKSQTQQGNGGSSNIGPTVTHQFEGSSSNSYGGGRKRAHDHMMQYLGDSSSSSGGRAGRGANVEEWVPLDMNFEEVNRAAHSLGNESQNFNVFTTQHIPTGSFKYGPYDPIYKELGLPVDPHLRKFMERQLQGDDAGNRK